MTSHRIDWPRLAGLLVVVGCIVGSWALIVWGVRWLLDVV